MGTFQGIIEEMNRNWCCVEFNLRIHEKLNGLQTFHCKSRNNLSMVGFQKFRGTKGGKDPKTILNMHSRKDKENIDTGASARSEWLVSVLQGYQDAV
jgi:hypothetical protein